MSLQACKLASTDPWSIKLEVNPGNYDDGPGIRCCTLRDFNRYSLGRDLGAEMGK